MRRLVGVCALLFGVLAMHGGLGLTCTDHAMTSAMASSPSSMPVASVAADDMSETGMTMHHTPAMPQPMSVQQMNHCEGMLPRDATTWTSLALVALAVVLAFEFRREHTPRARPSGREPPRLRYLDPVLGLGVIRT